MRNADLTIEEDEAADLLTEIEKQIRKRQWGEAIRLEVEDGIKDRLLNYLVDNLGIGNEDIFNISGPLDLTFLMKMYGIEGFDNLRNNPFKPQPVVDIDNDRDIFSQIREKDILLFHPFQTFESGS